MGRRLYPGANWAEAKHAYMAGWSIRSMPGWSDWSSADSDVSFFAISLEAEQRVLNGQFDSAYSALARISDKIQSILRQHGLAEDDCWPRGQGPEIYWALNDEYDRIHCLTVVATLEEFGEPGMAAMFRYNLDEFDRKYEAGRLKAMGPLPEQIERRS